MQHLSTTSSFSNLSPVQAQVVTALAQGATISSAARQAGLHRTTIHRWLNELAEFKSAVAQARRDYIAELSDQLRELSTLALKTLHDLLNEPTTPASVRLRAALAILQRPQFPFPGWQLPESIETPERQRIIDDFAAIQADYQRIRCQAPFEPRLPSQDNPAPSVPRNAPCPCGSGLKHKRCCGRDAPPMPGGPSGLQPCA